MRVILLDLAIAFGFGAGEMDHKVWGSMSLDPSGGGL